MAQEHSINVDERRQKRPGLTLTKRWVGTDHTPLTVLKVIVSFLSIFFFGELFVMAVLIQYPFESPLIAALVDSTVLILISSPVLYLFFYRPLRMHTEAQKKTEAELSINAAMFSNLAEGVFLIGFDDLIIKWTNPVFESMFGYESGELPGKPVALVNAPNDMTPEETRDVIVSLLKETGQWHLDAIYRFAVRE